MPTHEAQLAESDDVEIGDDGKNSGFVD